MRNQQPPEELRGAIVETARGLFRERGFKGTGVRDITEPVGISTGTFYNCFSSKEELFLIIYLEENERALRAVYARVPDPDAGGGDVTAVIKELVKAFFQAARENSILREFFNRSQFDRIFEKLTPEMDADYRSRIIPPFSRYFDRWAAGGKIKPVSIDFFFALMNALGYVAANQEKIGGEHFPRLLDFMIDAVVDALRPGTNG